MHLLNMFFQHPSVTNTKLNLLHILNKLSVKMYLVEDKGGAIALMLASLFFLGTWPAVMTLLERRGRLPQHTYLDYSITNLLAAVLIALTFGQLGDSKPGQPNFFTQLSQVQFSNAQLFSFVQSVFFLFVLILFCYPFCFFCPN
jgi:Ureide permease